MALFDSLRDKTRPNLGTFDRLLRTIIAVGLLVVVFVGVMDGWIIVLPILASIYLILTGDVGYSPIYRALGFSTIKDRETVGEGD